MNERTKKILFGRPKKKNDGEYLTRREIITLAFKIAFLEAMALSLILPSVTSTGETSIIYQTAFFKPGFTQVSGNPWTITFPTPFTSTPKVSIGYVTPIQQIVIPNCSANCLSGTINYTDTVSFVSNPTGVTWINMPAAQTEFLGNTNSEMELDLNATTLVNFSVTCTGSTNPNAGLFLQWRTAFSGTWFNVSSSVNAANVLSVSTAFGCPTTNITGWQKTINIPSVTSSLGIQVRVMGEFGGGTGDSPTFTELHAYFYKTVPYTLWFVPILTNLVIGTKNFNITALWQDAPSFHELDLYWIACSNC